MRRRPPPPRPARRARRGFWERGVPEGPFRSRETGSASSFVCLQFAITSNLGHWMTTCMPLPSVSGRGAAPNEGGRGPRS